MKDVQLDEQRHVRMQCCALIAQTQSTACRVHGPACAQGPTGLAFISFSAAARGGRISERRTAVFSPLFL